MPSLNSVTLMGNLTADPDLRHVPSGEAVVTFTLGINGPRKDDRPKRSDFIQCDLWGNWARNFVKTARKGALVIVEGRLVEDRWVDSKTNENRHRVKVLALRAFHVKAQYADDPSSMEDADEADVAEEPVVS
jgi:single-strand DNA-binding protein